MPLPGQPLRVLYWMNDWPVPDPWGFGEIFPEDGTFYEDAGATAQIKARWALDDILLVKISEVDPCIPGSPPFFERWIDAGTHGYNFILQECDYYNPPAPGIQLHPISSRWSCVGGP